MIIESLACVLIVFALTKVWKFLQRPKNFPPGPFIPIRAFINFVFAKNIFLAFRDTVRRWKVQYGPIIGICLGPYRFVYITDHESGREGMSHPNFQERPQLFSNIFSKFGITGALSSGPCKKLAQKSFNRYRRGKQEKYIQDSLLEYPDKLKAKLGQPVEVRGIFQVLVFGFTWNFLTDRHISLEETDPSSLSSDFKKAVVSGFILNSSPILSLYPRANKLQFFTKYQDRIRKIFNDVIDDHERTLDHENPRDLIDIFLLESNNTTDPTSCLYKEGGRKYLLATLVELFFGGGTTNIILSWALIYLAKFPEEQKKIQLEIDAKLGKRLPSMPDIEMMPITKSFIEEIFRKNFVIGIIGTRKASADTKFKGYDIPMDTTVSFVTEEYQLNPESWGDPDVFRPARFLSEDQSTFIPKADVMPFGGGIRICPADQMARSLVFMTVTFMCQRYRIEMAPSCRALSTDEKSGEDYLSPAMDFSVIISERV